MVPTIVINVKIFQMLTSEMIPLIAVPFVRRYMYAYVSKIVVPKHTYQTATS